MHHDYYFQSYISFCPCCEDYLHSRSHDHTVSIPQRSDIVYHIALIVAGGSLLVEWRKIACCVSDCKNQQPANSKLAWRLSSNQESALNVVWHRTKNRLKINSIRCHFHIIHNALCLPPNILHKRCFQFHLRTIVSPEGNWKQGICKMFGGKKVHYGQCESGEFIEIGPCMRDLFS